MSAPPPITITLGPNPVGPGVLGVVSPDEAVVCPNSPVVDADDDDEDEFEPGVWDGVSDVGSLRSLVNMVWYC